MGRVASVDEDIETLFFIKAFLDCGIVASKLKLVMPAQLQVDDFGGVRMHCDNHPCSNEHEHAQNSVPAGKAKAERGAIFPALMIEQYASLSKGVDARI